MSSTRLPHIFLRLFLPTALLLFAGTWFYGQAELERELTRLHSREKLNVGLGAGALSRNLESVTRDLRFLSSHSALRSAVNAPTPQNLTHLTEDFVNFSQSKGIYDQVRWLDEQGQEVARVDYRKGQALPVPAAKLQNKGKRYYFTDAFKLNPGEVFVSPLDLNIERGKVEVPFKPMIRVGGPILDDQGKQRGIVLLNFYGAAMLEVFEAASANIADHIAVVNNEGYWLNSPDPDREWGFMLNRMDQTLATQSPGAWSNILAEKTGQAVTADGLWTWETVFPLLVGQKSSRGAAEAFTPSRGDLENRAYFWKVVAHLPGDALNALTRQIWTKLAIICALLLGLIGLGSWKLARAWNAQAEAEEEVRRINIGLEILVDERTREIQEKVQELDVANAELGRKNEEMESMIYIASHDLRSPLVNIQGFSKRLENAADTIRQRLMEKDVEESVRASLAKMLEDRIPSSLDFIKSSSRKMDTLINGLLRLSRAGRAQLNILTLDMNAMAKEIVATLAIQTQEIGAVVTVDDLPPCRGDAPQINQVFTNLIDNAIKYRDPSRPLTVHVSGRRERDLAIFEVADNGLGIPREHQDKVWDLFHRLDPKGPVEGEGLGLTLARRIMDRNRGSIRLESQPGVGTRFYIELPAADLAEEPAP